MFRSMRVRMTVSLVVLLVSFGWIISVAIAHSTQLLERHTIVAQQHHIKLVLTTFMWVIFPAVALGAWIIVGRTLRPLRDLSHQADASSGNRLVAPSSDSEMVELVTTINRLLDRIEATAEAKTQFYAAASHELRTPLQALNGHIDTALSKDRPEGEYRDALVEAQKQTQRLTTLTRDILTLHQLQAQHPDVGEQADLIASINTAASELEPLIEARGLQVVQDLPSTLDRLGRQSYADVCVRNLIENAMRYATKGGLVTITESAEKITIANDCELPDSTNLEEFFEPFSSSNITRSASGGNGLGLAICRAAAHANGWSVSLSRSDGRVTAEITF